MVRIENILWAAQADGADVLRTNLLGEMEAHALYEEMLGWVGDDGTAPLYTLNFHWDSAFYSVEFFATLFDLCRRDEDVPDYFIALMQNAVGIREDEELARLVSMAFNRLDPVAA